jgi:hypothetical protein
LDDSILQKLRQLDKEDTTFKVKGILHNIYGHARAYQYGFLWGCVVRSDSVSCSRVLMFAEAVPWRCHRSLIGSGNVENARLG